MARQGPRALRHHAALRHHLVAGADGDGRRAGARASGSATCRRISRKTTPRSPSRRSSIRGRRDYTDVYEHYGLLGPKSLFGHCIHLSEREADALSAVGLGGGVLPDLQPVPRLRPVRLPALPHARQAAAHRRRDRCRRRHQLFDAAHHGRGLQGDRAATARSSTRSPRSGRSRAGNAEALSIARPGRHAGSRQGRRHRRARCQRHAGDAAADGDASRRLRRNCSCCRRSATTAPWSRSMSPGGRPRARCRRLGIGWRAVQRCRGGRQWTSSDDIAKIAEQEAALVFPASTRRRPSRSARRSASAA